MATLVVFSGTNDGYMYSGATPTYSLARTGAATFSVNTASGTGIVGQELFSGNYYCYEAGFDFDTSALGAGVSVSSAILSLYAFSELHSSSFASVFRARLYDWGATWTSADWVNWAGSPSLPLLAHVAHNALTTSAYNDFIDDAFAANVNKTGNTRILLDTDRLEAGTAPAAGQEYVTWVMADNAGTTQDPKLTITYSTGGRFDPFGMMGVFGI